MNWLTARIGTRLISSTRFHPIPRESKIQKLFLGKERRDNLCSGCKAKSNYLKNLFNGIGPASKKLHEKKMDQFPAYQKS